MDFQRDDFFASAAFSDQQNRNVRRGNIGDRALQGTHGRAYTMDEILIQAGARAEGPQSKADFRQPG